MAILAMGREFLLLGVVSAHTLARGFNGAATRLPGGPRDSLLSVYIKEACGAVGAGVDARANCRSVSQHH
ncbi:MAG: hypothetical protein WAN35_10225 [Terracidiphilus sp.]